MGWYDAKEMPPIEGARVIVFVRTTPPRHQVYKDCPYHEFIVISGVRRASGWELDASLDSPAVLGWMPHPSRSKWEDEFWTAFNKRFDTDPVLKEVLRRFPS